jgi:hypothetical protein
MNTRHHLVKLNQSLFIFYNTHTYKGLVNQLTSVSSKKLAVAQPFKKYPTFHGT